MIYFIIEKTEDNSYFIGHFNMMVITFFLELACIIISSGRVDVYEDDGAL